MKRQLLPILLFSVLLVACAGSSPQSSLDRYADALEAGDAKAAYALLSEEFRERVPFEEFESRFEVQREAYGEPLVKTLQQAADEPAFIDANLTYSEFDELKMVLTPDGWRLESGLFNFYGQRQPREALLSFIKAIERQKYDVLMQFIPNEYAQFMTVEQVREQFESNPARIQEMVALLKQNKHNDIRIRGNQAQMDYGPYMVTFKKEDGLWKIEDPD